jgi:osmotically-inducible protein OsmY
VTLTGHVEWLHQKRQAEAATQHVGGVRAVLNHIDVAPKTAQRDVRRRIIQSLHRNADLDARHIDVALTGDVVTLTGTVGSWSQREAAELGAGSAPGIRQVDNQIRVVPQEPHEFEPPDEIC